MEHKNANNITDVDLYNGFVWVQKDGKAVSMYYGKKIVWNVLTGVEEVQKMSIYTRVCYAILAANYSKTDREYLVIDPVKILVEPDGVKPFPVNAVCDDSKHNIIEKLRKLHEGVKGNGINYNG